MMGGRKLLGCADFTCDIRGSIELTEYATEIEKPFALHDIQQIRMRNGLYGDGVMMITMDHLPSELAMELSHHFGENLVPFLGILTYASFPSELIKLPDSWKGA